MGYIPYNKNKGGSMEKFEVVFYEKENGYCPVEEFIDALDVKMRAKLVGLLEILEEKGNQLREPYSKPIDDGFIKKTQKTPKKEMELAIKYKHDYKSREGEGNE